MLPHRSYALLVGRAPIVLLDSRLNSLRVNLESRFDLPTPESPISTTAHPRDRVRVCPQVALNSRCNGM